MIIFQLISNPKPQPQTELGLGFYLCLDHKLIQTLILSSAILIQAVNQNNLME